MVLGILIAAIVAPGLLGSQEAIRQGQSKDKREEHRARRCNLIATCVKSSPRSREIDGRPVVLRNGKLWIDTTTEDGEPFGHTYSGYYLPYPDTKYEGLVTTITDVAPIMNWVYIDRETHEAKYGVRADAQPNLTGPFDCTRQDRRLTFDGWEGWCAVEEYEGYWCLYFDIDDDGLKSKVTPGTRILEIELSRKEKRFKKEKEERQQDQTTKRAVDTKEDAPVDRPLQSEAEIRRPGVFNEPSPEPETMPMEGTAPKTPPPAYSKSDKSPSMPSAEYSKKGAVDALDNFLALEAQTAPQGRTMSPPPERPRLSLSNEKRSTPKLNRNSGSKAIAQAQMFEAMAAAQMRNDDATTRRASGNKRTSAASSIADSASVYSEEDQRLSREIRPQSSVSQRTYYQTSIVPPVPTVDPLPPQINNSPKVSSQPFALPTSQEDTPTSDPAVFWASAPDNSKRRSQAKSSSRQRKRNSRTFAVRRAGKRVSPRSSVKSSLAPMTSSGAGNSKSSSSNGTLNVRGSADKIREGRKTTSTLLRDLDDLVNQETAPKVPRKIRETPASGKEFPTRNEKRGSNGQAYKRPLRGT